MFEEKKIDAAHARECLEATAAVIGISRFIARGVQALYPEFNSKVTWIRSGVELRTFRPLWLMNKREAAATVARVPDHQRRPLILAVARLSKKKGVHVMINAMTEVLKKHPTARLSIVGSRWYGENTAHEYKAEVEELAKPFGDGVGPAYHHHQARRQCRSDGRRLQRPADQVTQGAGGVRRRDQSPSRPAGKGRGHGPLRPLARRKALEQLDDSTPRLLHHGFTWWGVGRRVAGRYRGWTGVPS